MRDCRRGIHDEVSDQLKIALYEALTLDHTTLEYYTTDGEVSGIGYTAGGNTLTTAIGAELQVDGTVITHFNDTSWSSCVFTTGCALIYNASKANRAIAVLPFGSLQAVTEARQFHIEFPTPTSDGAIIRSRHAE